MIYLYLATAAALILNGAVMFIDPQAWYTAIPGVTATGPLNAHLVRDVGCIYAVAGAGLLWRAFDPVRGWAAALAGAAFLMAHAGVHLLETLNGHHPAAPLVDIFGVYVPAALVGWLALPGERKYLSDQLRPLKSLLRRRVRAFEETFAYDASYMHEILETSLPAFLRFAMIEGLAKHREDVPVAVWYAAKLVAALSEDCGPCTQLVVDMAEREGVSPQLLEAIVTGDVEAMDIDTALGFRFATASLAHDFAANALREEIATRWGARAVVSMALTIAAARVFANVKYAMGHGQACTGVRIGGSEHVVKPYAELAPAAV